MNRSNKDSRSRSRIAGCFGRAGLGFALAAAVLVGFLQFVGLPGPAARSLRAAATSRGILLEFRRLRLDLPRGLLMKDARATMGIGERAWTINADRISLRPAWSSLVRAGALDLAGLDVRGLRFRAEGLESETGEAFLSVSRIRLDADGPDMQVRLEQGKIRGIHVEAEGRITGRPWREWVRDEEPAVVPDTEKRGFPQARDHLRRLLVEAEPFSFSVPPVIRTVFHVDLAAPENNRVDFALDAGGCTWRGVRVDAASARAEWAHNRLVLRRLEMRAAEAQGRAEGAWSPLEDRISGYVEGDGAWRFWRRALPDRLAAALDEIQVGAQGHLSFRWDVDAVSPADALHRGAGRLRATDLSLDGVIVEHVRMDIGWDRPRLRFGNVRGRLGRGDVEGDLELDLERRFLEARFNGAFDPDLVMPWLMPRQARYVGAAVFRSDLPEAEGEISGPWAERHALQLRCRVRGSDLVYNGSYLAGVEAEVRLDGHRLAFDSLRIERPEGELTGWVQVDLAESITDFEVESGVNPHAVARVIGPASHRFMQRFRFEGPVRVRAQGRADTSGTGWENRVAADIEGQGLGLGRFLADRATMTLAIEGREIRLLDFDADYAGGRVEGDAFFELAPAPESPVRYALNMQGKKMDLARLSFDWARSEAPAYDGKMNLDLNLEGLLGEGQEAATRGGGSLHIRGSGLLRIPVFMGLSEVLSRIYPGLGFFSQDVLHAELAIADERISSEAVTLEGGVISMVGRGFIGFDRQINGRVQVRLLRRGLAAEVLRFLTAPLAKLLEFDVGGTTVEPRWRPRNFSLESLPGTPP